MAVVSEVSQGPGWWVASDGKWYPPESHPATREAPPVQSQWHSMGDPARHQASPGPVETLVAPQVERAPGMGNQDEAFFAGKPRASSTNGARPAHGKRTSRRPLVLLLVLVLLLAGGAGYYFLIRKSSTTPSAGTTSTSGPQGTVAPGSRPAVGQSILLTVNGTTIKMTISRSLDPAPDRTALIAGNVTVAAYVTVTNRGRKGYALNNLAIGVSQGGASTGGDTSPTSAGAAFRQSGTLAPGASESGWLTSVASTKAGPVTAWNVVLNAKSAKSPASAVATSWTVK